MVKITNLSEKPGLIATNDPELFSKNIAHCNMSFILYHSNDCKYCKLFHPTYKKFCEKYKSSNNSCFYEISNDNNNKQTKDEIDKLIASCERNGYKYEGIPYLMCFSKNNIVDVLVGNVSSEKLNQFVKKCEKSI